MIDVGFWEVAMIGVMALIILGPERLPKVARTAGMWIGKARSMIRDVKADIKSEMDAADLSDLKNVGKDIRDAGEAFKSQVDAVDKSVQSEASEMDTAIADALNKPARNSENTEDVTSEAAKSAPETSKATTTAKTVPGSGSGSGTNKPAAKKKTSKKKAGKKKVTQKNASTQKAAKTAAKKKASKTTAVETPSTESNKN